MNQRSVRRERTQNQLSRRSSVLATCAVRSGVQDGAARFASLDKGKAGELRRQVAEIAEASGLDVKVRRSRHIRV